jgi:hypothetical protein
MVLVGHWTLKDCDEAAVAETIINAARGKTAPALLLDIRSSLVGDRSAKNKCQVTSTLIVIHNRAVEELSECSIAKKPSKLSNFNRICKL